MSSDFPRFLAMRIIDSTDAKWLMNANERDPLNAFWTYPLNAVICLVGIVVQPLCSLIVLVAAGVFALMSLCCYSDSREWGEMASYAFLMGAGSLIFCTALLAVKIFRPGFPDDCSENNNPQPNNNYNYQNNNTNVNYAVNNNASYNDEITPPQQEDEPFSVGPSSTPLDLWKRAW